MTALTIKQAVGQARRHGQHVVTRKESRQIAGAVRAAGLPCTPDDVWAEAARQDSVHQARKKSRKFRDRYCAKAPGRITMIQHQRKVERRRQRDDERERIRAAAEFDAALARCGRPSDEEIAAKKDRRRVMAGLRKLGFERVHTSGPSAYYQDAQSDVQARVSDHHVPMTDERADAVMRGGFSWAEGGWSFVAGEDDPQEFLADLAESLPHIRRAFRARLGLLP